ncbi:MAG: hybrid sensor histidine kinase/response regulator [Alkalinema sp. CACIAM 70d]|nr:MAG: hybrid sensor histidine kinase/response regulator [Alkalinema sp. CACIAM 70d]
MTSDSLHFTQGNILVVDDTPANLHLLAKVLTDHGYTVRLAPSGPLALRSINVCLPDLILLDIMMPEMDGYSVCRSLKDNEKTQNIPIIFLSALDEALDKVKAFKVGAEDYITKPFQEAEVLARVEHQLKLQCLQKQLIERNLALEQSNRELEQFAYIVSHDLQQPLQSVTGFIKLVKMQYQETLDDTVLEYLDRVAAAGGRMQQLIHDLLIYAKVGREALDWTAIDCNLLLEIVIENLRVTIDEKNAAILYQDLPTLQGNETQLIQLFQNLISNALKFVPPNVLPQVKISAEKRGNAWLFSIHDNGIGIKPENREQIFEAFRRLYNSKTYPGTGIGLATCKKIVENHGGRIWVDSQFGIGTTFYFTLEQPIYKFS